MSEIKQFINYEISQERMITFAQLQQKFTNRKFEIQNLLRQYYLENKANLEALFLVFREDDNGNGFISELLSEQQLMNKKKIKDISLIAIAQKDYLIQEELFSLSIIGNESLKVKPIEVNLSSLITAIATESQKVIVNKKVEGLDQKRKVEQSEIAPITFAKQANQENKSHENIILEQPKAQETKKPKIILKSKQQSQQQQQQIIEQSQGLPAPQEVIIQQKQIEIKPEQKIIPKNESPNSKISQKKNVKQQGKLDGFFIIKKQ